MSRLDDLVEALANDARPVRPLKPPLRRALGWLAAVGLTSGIAISWFSDFSRLTAYSTGQEEQLALQMAAMLATGIIAIIGAFYVSIPGRSRAWLFAPMVPFAAWLLLTGAGCYRDFVRSGASGLELGHSLNCLSFIVGVSLPLGAVLIWRLARARPVEPTRVALLGGLGVAALAAFILHFFHPFAVTLIDLAFHLLAIALVVGATTLLNRRTLSPA